MLPRTLEPEVMDTAEEAADYDAMDHDEVNRVFSADLLEACGSRFDSARSIQALDVGTGTALIPIEVCRQVEHGNPMRERRPQAVAWHITAIDLADEMLKLARRNVNRAGVADRIQLVCVDSKSLPFEDAAFDLVMSNSIIHHIPDPIDCLREMWRVLKPGGLLFVRDLYRPDAVATVESLVRQYAGEESPRQQQLFRQSFHAALTVDEVQSMAHACGISNGACRMTSNRHWTLVAFKERL